MADDGRFDAGSAIDGGTGVSDVREHCGGTDEHLGFEGDAIIDGDVVLDPAPVPNLCALGNEDILTEHAPRAHARARHQVTEVPDFGAGADASAPINHGRRVGPVGAPAHVTSTGVPPTAIDRAPAATTRTTASPWAAFPPVVSPLAAEAAKWTHWA